jgi:hypothetical protein
MAYHLTIKGDQNMRAGLIISLTVYAALSLSGCGLLPGGTSLTLENYRIDERKAETQQYRADNKPLWCFLVPGGCPKKAPLHREVQADGEVSGS